MRWWCPPLDPGLRLKRVDFISDLHLCAGLPRTTQAFLGYLSRTSANAVVILGDLFEVWVGDDARHQLWEQTIMRALANRTASKPVAFMVGNRDFLLGDEMLKACGMSALPDPALVQTPTGPVVVSHGDALCSGDLPYQAFRLQVRATSWRSEFLAKPLLERQRIAAEIRHTSRSRHAFDGSPVIDVDAKQAIDLLRTTKATTLIHGHTHRPADHDLEPSGRFRRVVLSDWDLDHANPQRGEVLVWDEAGPRRLTPAEAAE